VRSVVQPSALCVAHREWSSQVAADRMQRPDLRRGIAGFAGLRRCLVVLGSLACLLVCTSSGLEPARRDLDGNDEQGAFQVWVDLQVDLIARRQVHQLHEVSRDRHLPVLSDAVRTMWRRHATNLRNICR